MDDKLSRCEEDILQYPDATIKERMKRLHMSPNLILYYYKVLGWESKPPGRPGKKVTKEEIIEDFEKYPSDLKQNRAQRLGVSASQFFYLLKRYDLYNKATSKVNYLKLIREDFEKHPAGVLPERAKRIGIQSYIIRYYWNKYLKNDYPLNTRLNKLEKRKQIFEVLKKDIKSFPHLTRYERAKHLNIAWPTFSYYWNAYQKALKKGKD